MALKSPTASSAASVASVVTATLAMTLALAACGAGDSEEEPAGVVAFSRVKDHPLGTGYLVWESNRSGTWRIWRRALADSAPSQLTADEPERWHCCPHISPDGRRIALSGLADSRSVCLP